jgi:hypothetical protein
MGSMRQEGGQPAALVLDHGWRLTNLPGMTAETIDGFLRAPIHAVPKSVAEQIGDCDISIVTALDDPESTSEWSWLDDRLELKLVSATDPHDTALELLFCLGQALWETLSSKQRSAYLERLASEFQAGVEGEIDEDTLREKTALLSARRLARNPDRLERYASTSFAATAAEFLHALWHDVTVQTGPGHLPPDHLRARLEMIARWFPPDRGYKLFP